MKKIPTLFVRDRETNHVVDSVTPGCEWVADGEGIGTRKYDGTCVLVRDGRLFKRHEVKPGATPPAGFEPADDLDEVTGKRQGWVPVGDGPEDRWHREAIEAPGMPPDGTYELCGPDVQGNPEGHARHVLIAHGMHALEGVPRDFAGLKAYLAENDIEGVVFHHPDGRMVKVKGRDFGIKRRAKTAALPSGTP